MSDTSEIQQIEFEAPEGPQDYEVVTVGSEEDLVEKPVLPPDDEVKLKKDQYEALLRQTNGTETLANGLSRLAETLTPQPQQAQPFMPEIDPLKLEDEALKPGQFVKTVEQIANKVAAQQTAQFAVANQMQEKKILELDPQSGEIFKKYAKEIEAKVAALPPQYRFQPGVYTQMYRQTVQEHQEDIINERAAAQAQKIAEAAVAKALAEAGIKPKSGSSPTYAETGGTAPAVRPKTTLKITQRDVMNMLDSQMDPKDPVQVRSYLDWKRERGIK